MTISFKCFMTHYIQLLSLSGLISFTTGFEVFPGPRFIHCTNGTTYKPGSKFQANLDVLLSALTSNATQDNGFYSTVIGWGTIDIINGEFLCRGDILPTACKDCVTDAAKEIRRDCPNQTESLIYYDLCMLRYTNQSFKFDSMLAGWYINNKKSVNSSDQGLLKQLLGGFLKDLAAKAVNSPSSEKKYATGEVPFTGTQKLYGLEQCTPDLGTEECIKCLETAIGTLPSCCEGRQGARVLLPGCNMRYELYPFYNFTATSTAPQVPPSPSPGKTDTRSRTVVVIVVPIVVIVLTLLGLGCYLLWRKAKKSKKAILKENFGEESSNLKSLRFNLATIKTATNEFSFENRIGKGGFGEVYKGILPGGQEIAVKRLSKSSSQGAIEFKNEVLLIAKLQHRNLVTLLGFCLDEQEKILIYEYVPNKSLDYFLFDSEKRRLLSWPQRYKILGGIARGLLYLHDHSRLKVIHRDLKPSNVLLDNNMNPKISDFGLARMVAIDQDQGCTSRIVGTYGYMSPEYAMRGHFSEKSDVFSFGVMILEIISGKRNTSTHGSHSHLLSHAWKHWHVQSPQEIMDPYLTESSSQLEELIKCVQIGLLCVQENPDDRPTMANIVYYITNLSIELPSPQEPAFFMHNKAQPNMSSYLGSSQSFQSSKPPSLNEISKSEFLPR